MWLFLETLDSFGIATLLVTFYGKYWLFFGTKALLVILTLFVMVTLSVTRIGNFELSSGIVTLLVILSGISWFSLVIVPLCNSFWSIITLDFLWHSWFVCNYIFLVNLTHIGTYLCQTQSRYSFLTHSANSASLWWPSNYHSWHFSLIFVLSSN